MKYLKFALLIVLTGFFAACADKDMDSEDTTTVDTVNTTIPADNTSEGITGSTGTQENTQEGSDPLAAKAGEAGDPQSNNNKYSKRSLENKVEETGQYNSNIGTPPPPNTSRTGAPEHTYGDTANRMDGANSVR